MAGSSEFPLEKGSHLLDQCGSQAGSLDPPKSTKINLKGHQMIKRKTSVTEKMFFLLFFVLVFKILDNFNSSDLKIKKL